MVCISANSAEATFLYTVIISPGVLERYDKNTVGLSIPDSIGDFPEKQKNIACPSSSIFTDGGK